MRRYILALALLAPGAPGAASAKIQQSLDIRVIEAPDTVRVGDSHQLVYELHLTNFSSHSIRLDKLVVKSGDGDIPLKSYGGEELAVAAAIIGPKDGADARMVGSGRRAVLYINAPVSGHPGGQISHILTLGRIDPKGAEETMVVSGGPATVAPVGLPRLSPPLRGGPWVAVYAPDMERGHRRVFYAVDGKATLPGRFAIDWMKVDNSGRLAAGDNNIPANHYGFGAEVLAVADGIIVALRDDVPDPAALSGRTNPSLADASGNFVALDIGGGRYAIYEHLKQGAPVAVGDRVKTGDVVGFLGFTGQASAPHLHFHLADSPSLLGAEGKPYAITALTRLGQYASIEAFGRGEKWPTTDRPETVRDSFPPPNLVVRFAAN